MAAVLATALTFGSVTAVSAACATVARRMACRWVRDPATGRLVCTWEPDPECRRPTLHLKLVRS